MIILPPQPDTDFPLKSGETIVACWGPNRRVFLQSKIFVSALTSLCLGGPGAAILVAYIRPYLGETGLFSMIAIGLLLIVGFVISCLYYAIIFDEHRDWNRVKDMQWTLTNQRFVAHSTEDAPYWVPLGDIQRVSRLMWWRLFIRFADLGLIETAYIPKQSLARRAVLAAKDGDFAAAATFAEQSNEGSK